MDASDGLADQRVGAGGEKVNWYAALANRRMASHLKTGWPVEKREFQRACIAASSSFDLIVACGLYVDQIKPETRTFSHNVFQRKNWRSPLL